MSSQINPPPPALSDLEARVRNFSPYRKTLATDTSSSHDFSNKLQLNEDEVFYPTLGNIQEREGYNQEKAVKKQNQSYSFGGVHHRQNKSEGEDEENFYVDIA
jgi:hypothetical protein